MVQIDHVGHLRNEAERFALAVEHGPLDAPVDACPDWDLRALTLHLGHVHRWARLAAATGARPGRGEVPGPPEGTENPAALAEWLRAGAEALARTLSTVDPDAPTWHPFPVPLVAGVWPRRQAQETLVHRWDAEHAVGATTAIDPLLAADGIDEYFTVMLPRLLMRDGIVLPGGSIHVECTDTPAGWIVSAVDGEVFVSGGCTGQTAETHHEPRGRARVEASAEQILLTLWGRDRGGTALEVHGDAGTAAGWFALGGV